MLRQRRSSMKTNNKQIWFPAKKYGWGWGPPCAWQGWVVMGMFVILLSAAAILFLPRGRWDFWIASIIVLVTALFSVCLAKGETPRWRWGESTKPETRSAADRLAELDGLHRRQLISDSEYQAKREAILKEL
jgi:hypothetical protein